MSKFGLNKGCCVTEHGVTEQWSYADSDSLVWLRITSHYCNNAWRLLWFDHGSSPHLRKTAHNYGKGGASIYGLRRLECMTARQLAIQRTGGKFWSGRF